MRVGIHLPHIGRKAGPEAIRRAAVQAEELGFADAWTSEHIIIPKGAPYPPSALFYDPVLTLTWAAAYTKRIGLGTSVLVLPMRHPLPLAKELATLQNLSEGRLILGAGVGWLEAEFAALGVPFRERGRRMDEGIAMMLAVWGEDPVSFAARHIPAVIENMRMLPQPVKPIPIWIGGSSEAHSPAPCGSTAGTARGCHPRRRHRSCGGCARSGRNPGSRSRCAAAGRAKTTASSVRALPPMAKPGSGISWSSPASARSTTGYAPSSGSPAWRRETYDEIGHDPEVLAHLRRRHEPRVGGRTARL
jgi:probable F420-dependent oxidoreductase